MHVVDQDIRLHFRINSGRTTAKVQAVDMSIPASSSIAEVLAEVLDLAQAPAVSVPWQATTPAGIEIDANESIANIGLTHGSVVMLRPRRPTPVPVLRDSAEAVSALAQFERPARHTSIVAAATGALGCIALLCLSASGLHAALACVIAAVLLTSAFTFKPNALIMPMIATLVGIAAGIYVTGHHAEDGVWGLLAGVVAAMSAIGVCWVIVRLRTGVHLRFRHLDCSAQGQAIGLGRGGASKRGSTRRAGSHSGATALPQGEAMRSPAASGRKGQQAYELEDVSGTSAEQKHHKHPAQLGCSGVLSREEADALRTSCIASLASCFLLGCGVPAGWMHQHYLSDPLGWLVGASALVILGGALLALAAPLLAAHLAGLSVPRVPTAGEDLGHGDAEHDPMVLNEQAKVARVMFNGLHLAITITSVPALLLLAVGSLPSVGMHGHAGACVALGLSVALALLLHAHRHQSALSIWCMWLVAMAALLSASISAAAHGHWAWLSLSGLACGALALASAWSPRLRNLAPTTVVWIERLEAASVCLAIPLTLQILGLFSLLRGHAG
ncbi:type VII secretion integral membrane protein EccD [Corynebacterium pseudopelargi]|uniref:EccD-like transmembrane domain-containing protein n=1 Tax=Corynebacterium pseudopelargi TaxID=2080757 RepID=A0A3G6J0R1_9CORY|nr:type VII secretion integral membrane protein EccD [Corynebacterium pseudopelargi]AZA09950.1 hypothetical protein CPPEL_09235 [Corynebacterium pseudopelargi]